jgi:hypothetical protein
MKEYFQKIKDVGQSAHDNLVNSFYKVSRAYSDSVHLNDWMIYGSSRLGSVTANLSLISVKFYGDTNAQGRVEEPDYIQSYEPYIDATKGSFNRADKQYELSNHLGNVLVVITDKKIWNCTGHYYTADLVQATDYSPFGAPLAQRSWNKRIILNNQFTNNTEGWLGTTGSPTLGNNAGRLSVTGPTCTVSRQIATEPGKVYELYIDIDAGDYESVTVGVYGSAADSYPLNKLFELVNGKQRVYFTATSSEMYVRIMPKTTSGTQTAYVNFIEIKRVSDATTYCSRKHDHRYR